MMATDNYINRTSFTPKPYTATSTDDINESETYGECVFVGVFYNKPTSSSLTVTVTNPSGLVVKSIDISALDGLGNGYRSLLWPILEGATIAVETGGGVSGGKWVELIFLPNRGSAV